MRSCLLAAVMVTPLAWTTLAMSAEVQAQSSSEIVLKDTKSSPGSVRATTLMGTEILAPDGKDVGKVKDIVLNPSVSKVEYIVLGQTKGITEKRVALPFAAIKFGPSGEDRVYLSFGEDVLDRAPGFDDDNWPARVNVDFARSIDTYYDTDLVAELDLDNQEAQPAAGQVGSDQIDWTRRASKLENREVISPTGQELGKITDIVLDQKTGEVTYAAVKDYRGQMHAVSMSAFSMDLNDRKLILNTTRDELKGIPGFDENRWPSKPDPRWSKAETQSQREMR